MSLAFINPLRPQLPVWPWIKNIGRQVSKVNKQDFLQAIHHQIIFRKTIEEGVRPLPEIALSVVHRRCVSRGHASNTPHHGRRGDTPHPPPQRPDM